MANLYFKKVKILAIILLAIILLITNPTSIRKTLQAIAIPIETLGAKLRGSSGSLYNALKENERLKKENERLKSQTGRLADKLARKEEVSRENERLREILDYKEKVGRKIVVANLLGYDPASLLSTIIIDRGTDDGLRKGLCVVTIKEEKELLLGRIIDVFHSSSIVLLVTDKSSLIPVMLVETGEKGILVGADGEPSLAFIESHIDPKPKEDVITIEDRDIPSGILIGKLGKIGPKKIGLFREIKVRVGFDISQLREVLVIVR
ncbi:MAG: rod shape-determining protein MreC [bacterium]|nr:rod shape-determining protein MreC [bacterium]